MIVDNVNDDDVHNDMMDVSNDKVDCVGDAYINNDYNYYNINDCRGGDQSNK